MRKRRDYGNLKVAAHAVIARLRDAKQFPSGFTVERSLEIFQREAGLPANLTDMVVKRFQGRLTGDMIGFSLYEYWIMQLRTTKDVRVAASGRRLTLRAFVWVPNGHGRHGHMWQRRNTRLFEVQEVMKDRQARQRAGGDVVLLFQVGAPILERLGARATFADVEDQVLAAL